MFNDQNVKPAPNGRMRGDDAPASASAKRIEYRDIDQTLEVELAGKEYVVRAGSLFLYNTLKNKIAKHRSEVLKKAEHVEELIAKLKSLSDTVQQQPEKKTRKRKKTAAQDTEEQLPLETEDETAVTPDPAIPGMERTKEILGIYQELFGERWSIIDATETEMLRCIQLILLDGKNPNWVDEHDAFPPDNELEAVVSTKELQRKASIIELNNVLSVYKQMNDPEAAKQDFFKIAGMAMM